VKSVRNQPSSELAEAQNEDLRFRLLEIFTRQGVNDTEELADDARQRLIDKIKNINTTDLDQMNRVFMAIAQRIEKALAANKALEVAIAIIDQLPVKLQMQLAKQLLEKASSDENFSVLYLKKLAQEKQNRLAELMEKHNEGETTREEKAELRQLNNEVNRALLDNSITLAKALRPELFNKKHRRIKRRAP